MRKIVENLFYGLGIRQKLLFFIALIVSFLLIQSVYIIHRDYKMLERYQDDNESLKQVSELKKNLMNHNVYLNQYFKETILNNSGVFNDSTLAILSEFNHAGYSIFDNIRELEENVRSLEEFLLLQSIKNSSEIYREEANIAIREYNNNATGGQSRVNEMYVYIDGYIDKFIEESSAVRDADYEDLFKEWSKNKNLTIMVLFLVIVFIIIIGLVFSEYLVRNIRRIIQLQLQIASGDFSGPLQEGELQDEMGELNSSLKVMKEGIKEQFDKMNEKSLMERRLYQEKVLNLEMQKTLDDAKYAMLQSQINPHFLFNTLNIIARKAMFNDSEEAVRLTQALSQLFRHSLIDIHEKVSLEKELDVVREYLYIQKSRFGSRLSFQIITEVEELEQIMIPPLIIQPIVENAIVHGIEPQEGIGKLTISVKRMCNQINVVIQDNGAGMDMTTLEKIQDMEKSSSIGLLNVKKRMEHLYQNDNVFQIQSQVDKGTKVTLIFTLCS